MNPCVSDRPSTRNDRSVACHRHRDSRGRGSRELPDRRCGRGGRQPTIDGTVYFGPKNGPTLIKVMHKIMDQQNRETGTRLGARQNGRFPRADYESGGRGFESSSARHLSHWNQTFFPPLGQFPTGPVCSWFARFIVGAFSITKVTAPANTCAQARNLSRFRFIAARRWHPHGQLDRMGQSLPLPPA